MYSEEEIRALIKVIIQDTNAKDLNDIGNFYVFRQNDAHAWAEVWFENEGWVRVDPTKFIPAENVRNTLNDLFNSNKTSENFISSSFKNGVSTFMFKDLAISFDGKCIIFFKLM